MAVASRDIPAVLTRFVRSFYLVMFLSVAAFATGLPTVAFADDLPEVPFVPGPKRTVAVGQIEATGGFDVGENWDVGGGLASMLTTELLQSGRFNIVERADLASVLNEQKVQTSNLTTASPGGGGLTTAQYLIVGSVTEFGAAKKGGGLSLGGSFGGILGGVGLNKKSGQVGLDLRLVDVKTGIVLVSFNVTESVSKTGVALQSGYKGVAIGGEQFVKTPLGQAARAALRQSVIRIAETLAAQNWQGRIVTYENNMTAINVGSDGGVQSGDRFRVERIGQVLTDPETGRVLTEGRYHIGDLVVNSIAPEVSFAAFTSSNGQAEPVRGDLVIPMKQSAQ